MTLESSIWESLDGRCVVRLVNGVGSPREYRCASTAAARTLLQELGLDQPVRRKRKAKHKRRAAPYRVQLSATSREEIGHLHEDEWEDVRAALAQLAVDAGGTPPPSYAMLVAAGIQPPVLRLRQGRHVVLYEGDAEQRTLTIQRVLEIA